MVSLAHDFDSPFLPPVVLPLPTAVDGDVLRRHIAELEPEGCTAVRADVPTRFMLFRVDKELAERINAWCDDHDVEYASYMRSILRLAAGFESEEELRPHHVQDQLVPYAADRGRAVAS
ncbi:MAG: hypothetical protein L0H96_25815 [Humibacillus sp.]|nr:hypothetical protein [Humibacillus sp.]